MFEAFLLSQAETWRLMAYLIIFAGVLMEGEIIIFLAIYLAHQGILSLPITIVLVVVGVLCGDVLWFNLGPRIANAWFVPKALESTSEMIEARIRERSFGVLVLSKFTYGLHRVVLLHMKEAGVTLQQFVRMDVIASALWLVVVGGLGFVFSASISSAKHYMRNAEILLLVGVALFFLMGHSVRRLAKKYFRQ